MLDMTDMLKGLAEGLFPNLKFPDAPKTERGESGPKTVSIAPMPIPVTVVSSTTTPATMPGSQVFGGHTGSAQPPPIPMEMPAPDGGHSLPTPMPQTGTSTAPQAAGAGIPPSPPDRTNEYMAAWQPFEPFWSSPGASSQDIGQMPATAGPKAFDVGPSFIPSAEPGHTDSTPGESAAGERGMGEKLGKLTDAIQDLIRSLDDAKRSQTQQTQQPGPQQGGGFVPQGMPGAAQSTGMQRPQTQARGMPTAASGATPPWLAAINRSRGG
jgi:hypothetical protein